MKTIIAGSRNITTYEYIASAIETCPWKITEVIAGGARGVDTQAVFWAVANKIPYKVFPAKWKLYGKVAGRLRNAEMADNAEALVAIWDGQSTGTANMLSIAKSRGMLTHMVLSTGKL